ncbi:ATP-binding cassette [Lithospermum erythrorhizon]|uniref:ATP-binding cassette n=1 Tax=Lithospermum erythrorhizon TaxID=34254 RepID=A0AAV3QKK3_LITER
MEGRGCEGHDNLNSIIEASCAGDTLMDGLSVPAGTNNPLSVATSRHTSDIGKNIMKMRSSHLKDSGRQLAMRKTKSLSAQMVINIDALQSNGFDQADSSIKRAFSSDVALFSLNVSQLPSESISNALLQDSDQTPISNDGNQNLSSWGTVQHALPISLKFQDVRYKIQVNSETYSDSGGRFLLQGVTGSVFPGELLALMGPSGGGKTTLLSVLSGRIKSNCGTISYNDRPYTKSLKQRIGYVLQDDVVYPHLTVKETLTYAALLRLPNTLSKEQKKERAMNVIMELGLERCQDAIIGGAFVRGISGGERKRVCIGNEILLNPSLLFLDEPTSGLDSTTALLIVQVLQNIAKAGKTVVTTIHQPSSRLFNKFDKLVLLGKGCALYFGQASQAMLYFSSLGCYPLIAMNPAEFLVDLANGNIKDKSIPSKLEDKFLPRNQSSLINDGRVSPADVHNYLVGAYESSIVNLVKVEFKLIEDIMGRQKILPECSGATWLEQFSILFNRGLKARRHEYLSSLRIIQVISAALIAGMLWFNSKASSKEKVEDQESTMRAGLLFFISVFWAFFPLFSAIFTFPQERAVLAKERSVHMYRVSAYLIARNMSDLPLELVLPVIFLIIVYFMVGLKLTFSAFALTLLTIFLSIIAAQGLGLAIGAAFMDIKKASTFASVTIMSFMLSGGFFIQRIPSFMSWLRYVSFNYYTLRLLLKIQYSCSSATSKAIACNSKFIKGQKLDQGAREVAAMFIMIIGYRIVAYYFLRTLRLRTSL